jgi:nucleoside-diphosphate-sugar epimerase
MKGNIFNDINDQLFTESQNLYIRNLNSVFDLLYIDDLVNCLGKIIDLKLLGLFNLSSREETTPSEIVRNILDELNITKIVEETDPDKTSYLNVDNAKISEAILWKPQFNLAKGIRDLIKKGYFK